MRSVRREKIPVARIDRQALQNRFAEFLGAGRPIELEIGCGVGWHPLARALNLPGTLIIAVERTSAKFAAFQSRRRHHPPMPALLALHADARALLAHDIPPGSLDRIWILYPNPEPHNPSARWGRSPALALVAEALRGTGELIVASNERFYLEELRKGAAAHGLEVSAERSLSKALGDPPRTHFEKKYLERGQTCFEVTFRPIAQQRPVEPKPPTPR